MASSNPSDEEIPCSSNSVCDLMEVGDSDVEGGNVEVDESPLKPSLSRNKECKFRLKNFNIPGQKQRQ